jgi:uncharacterized damage-inducible protein DinB
MLHRPRHLRAVLALVVTLAAAAPMMTARAQDAMDAKTAGFLRDRYVADMDSVHAKIMALAAAIPEDKYSWRPAAGVRSVSEVLMHLASEWMFYTPMSVGGKPPADFGPPRETLPRLEKITGKADVIAQLDKGWAYGRQQLTSADPAALTGQYAPWKVTLAEAAFGMTGDQHEHLGQLIAYARSVGVKPPWSK